MDGYVKSHWNLGFSIFFLHKFMSTYNANHLLYLPDFQSR